MKQAKQHVMRCAFGVCVLFILHPAKAPAQLALNSQKRASVSAFSISPKKIDPLSIGDYVPEIVFENVLNYKSKKVKLSAFKGKLVILDLWSTWCTSCIAAFPKMEQLQNKFKDQIQILLVNPYDAKFDSEERIKLTLEKNKKRTGFYPSLPIPIHDSILNSYFPHQSVPHQVWIDGEGKVIAITGSNEVREENIKKYLEGKTLSMHLKDDWSYNKSIPLLIDGNGGDSKDFIFRSLFTGYKAEIGVGSGVRVNANKEAIGVYLINKSMRHLVNSAFNEVIGDIRANRVFLNVKNPVQFKQEFDTAFAYCYDLTFPPIKTDSLKITKYLQEDLKHYFNIRVYREKRTLSCLVITATNKLIQSTTKYDQPDLDFDKTSIKKFIHNYSIAEVLRFLDQYEKPLINETGISSHIDIDFPDNVTLANIDTVINALAKAGFSIREENRELEVVVITDK